MTSSSAGRRQPIFTAPAIVVWTLGALWAAYGFFLIAPRGLQTVLAPFFDLKPAVLLAGPEANGGVIKMLSPLIGHMFLHADLMHILFNSLWMLAMGAPVMRRFNKGGPSGPYMAQIIGGRIFTPINPTDEGRPANGGAWRSPVLFLLFFFASGAAGALAYVSVNANSMVTLVGASGGVSGLLGAMVRFAFQRPGLFSAAEQPIAPLTDKSIWVWSGAIVFINIAMGVFGIGTGGNANIAWEAHLGGYFFGLFAFPLFDALSKR